MKTFPNKKSLPQGISLAVLTKNKNTATAVLSFSVGAINANHNKRVQLLPDGPFAAKDGRPFDVKGGKWIMDAEAFAQLKANANNRTNDYHFDYEHQTLNSEDNGQPAPAAGWFNELEYVPGEGLFANNVGWTPKAQSHIDDKEYRYTSAVFSYDTETGRPVSLEHVALTNDPALDGMKAIAALKAQPHLSEKPSPTKTTTNPSGEETMNEAMKLFLDLIGVPHTGVDFTNEAALKKVQDLAKTAIAALKTKADRTETLETELSTAKANVVALKAQGGAVDLTQYVPKAAYDANLLQLAALSSEAGKNSIAQLLKDNSDKVLAAEIEYLTDFGNQQGFAALKQMVEARPAIAALKQTQTQGKKSPEDKQGDKLSTEQLAVCKNMGISTEDFKAQLAKEGEQ